MKSKPHILLLFLLYLATLLASIASLCMLTLDFAAAPFAFAVYILFGIAACLLGYSIYTLVCFAPIIKQQTITFLMRHTLTRSLLSDFGFRTFAAALGSFTVSVIYSGFHGILALWEGSVWYGALAGYYLLLALMRGRLFFAFRSSDRNGTKALRAYRNCGILLILLDVALSVAIVEMIFNDRGFSYAGLMIYASAAYAFYKITLSVINLVRARRGEDLAVEAIRNIGLADAAVSILALQTAMFAAFPAEGIDTSLFNTQTGAAVSLLTVGLGVFMILRAQKLKKNRTDI